MTISTIYRCDWGTRLTVFLASHANVSKGLSSIEKFCSWIPKKKKLRLRPLFLSLQCTCCCFDDGLAYNIESQTCTLFAISVGRNLALQLINAGARPHVLNL